MGKSILLFLMSHIICMGDSKLYWKLTTVDFYAFLYRKKRYGLSIGKLIYIVLNCEVITMYYDTFIKMDGQIFLPLNFSKNN